jgi:hypothetical protein
MTVRSWFDKPVLSNVEGLTTNGLTGGSLMRVLVGAQMVLER